MPSPSEKHFLYHLIISQLYHDGFGPHATLLEEAALQTNRAIAPSDRLKRMLSACAYTVREVDQDFERRNEASHKEQQKATPILIGERPPMRSSTPSPYHTLARRRLTAAKRHSVLSSSRGKHLRPNSRSSLLNSQKGTNLSHLTSNSAPPQLQSEKPKQVSPSSNSGSNDLLQTNTSSEEHGLSSASLHGLCSRSQDLSACNPPSRIASSSQGISAVSLPSVSSASAMQGLQSSSSALEKLSSQNSALQGLSSSAGLQNLTSAPSALQALSSSSPSMQGLTSALSVSMDSATNSSVLHNFFASSDGNLFSTAHKDQSAEAVRVLQNIFQKRDILPMVQSDMSHDLNSLIQASTDVITSSPLPTPTVSISASTSSESTTDPKPKQETPSEGEDAMIEEPPPIPGPPTLSAIQKMVFMDGPVDMEGDIDGSMKSSNTSPTSGLSLGNNTYGEEYKSEGSPTVKEEIQDHDEDEVHNYPSNSQDIINQLNSLSASGMSNTNLQNLANSLSSGLSEHPENHLNTLTNLSLNLSESLASSLNLANPGLDSTAGPSSSSLNQTFSGMTPSKLELYNRLECGDKPSMLSMVNAQRPPGAAGTPPGSGSQDWGATGEEKYYQCPYCPKVYTTTQSLHRHKHSHTGTNMKACPLCGKTSYRVDNLKSHIRNCYKKRLRMENLGGSDCSLES